MKNKSIFKHFRFSFILLAFISRIANASQADCLYLIPQGRALITGAIARDIVNCLIIKQSTGLVGPAGPRGATGVNGSTGPLEFQGWLERMAALGPQVRLGLLEWPELMVSALQVLLEQMEILTLQVPRALMVSQAQLDWPVQLG